VVAGEARSDEGDVGRRDVEDPPDRAITDRDRREPQTREDGRPPEWVLVSTGAGDRGDVGVRAKSSIEAGQPVERMDGVCVGGYYDFAAGIHGVSRSRRANAELRFVQDPSAVAAGNGRGVIGAVVVHNDNFVWTREILSVQGFQGRLEVAGFVVGRYYDREAVRADVVLHHGVPASVAASG